MAGEEGGGGVACLETETSTKMKKNWVAEATLKLLCSVYVQSN